MADGTLYIVPLVRFEYRIGETRYRGRKWLCTEEQDDQPCVLVNGQAVTALPIYVQGEHALDFFSGKKFGTVVCSEHGTVLTVGKIHAPLAAADPKNGINYQATAAEVKAFLEPYRPNQKEIGEEIRLRFEAVNSDLELTLPEEEDVCAAGRKRTGAAESSGKAGKGEKTGKSRKAGQPGRISRREKRKKRRKILLTVLLVIVLAVACFLAVRSFNSRCGWDVKWTYNSNYSALGIKGDGTTWDYPMTLLKLDTPWNRKGYDASQIQSVDIAEGVTSVGEKLFSGTAITSVYIPDTVTTIGDEAFRDCTQLSSVTITTGVTSIGNDAFCTNGGDDNILCIYYKGSSEEWVQLMKDTVIDSKGCYIWVSCTDEWLIQNAYGGIYGHTGDDEWTRLDDDQHDIMSGEEVLEALDSAMKAADAGNEG